MRNKNLEYEKIKSDIHYYRTSKFTSMYTMLQAFQLFSATSGLKVNEQKLDFYTAGVPREEIQRIKDASGFNQSKLPFKYLGVPICAKGITIDECIKLVEKMTVRIKILLGV